MHLVPVNAGHNANCKFGRCSNDLTQEISYLSVSGGCRYLDLIADLFFRFLCRMFLTSGTLKIVNDSDCGSASYFINISVWHFFIGREGERAPC